MIGNDIVDLHVAVLESNWKRRGFLEKLFSVEEQAAILTGPFPEKKLWSFWAMKEATYKAHQRRFCLSRSFNPRFFVCEAGTRTSGSVQAGDFTYFTRISENGNYIHCIASAVPEQKNISRISEKPEDLKEAFLADYTSIAQLPEGVKILKDENAVPQLFWQDKLIPACFSFSHHGRYCAYAAAR